MKKFICSIIFVVLAIVVSSPVLAVAVEHIVGEVTVKFPDSYICLSESNISDKSNKEIIQKLGGSAEVMKKDFEKENIILIAVKSDLSEQFEVRAVATDFSKEIYSLKAIKDEEIIEGIGEGLLCTSNFSQYSINGHIFLRNSYDEKSQSLTYITIENGKLYTFTYFGNDPFLAAETISGFSIKSTGGVSALGLSEWIMVIIILLAIIGILVAIVFLTVSLIKDYKRRKNENIVSQYIKIKKRF